MLRRLPVASVDVQRCPDVRVMLINPPQSYPVELRHEYQSYFPMGIACLAGALEATGAQIRVIDCLAYAEERRSVDLVWFGLGLDRLRAEIEAFRPHVVGISNPFSMFLSDARCVARLVKSVDPAIQVLLGGIEASVSPNNRRLLADCADIDILVRGEGELTLRELVGRFSIDKKKFGDLSQVHGILFRDRDGRVQMTPERAWIADLDALPGPAYHLLDMDRMFDNPFYARWRGRPSNGGRCLPVHTSRGCPYSCSFCSVHSQVGKANRRADPTSIASHVARLQRDYGVTHIHFEDDNLTLNPEHTRALFTAIAPLGVTFDTPNGLRADTITPDVARLLRDAGARTITIAVESGVQRILDGVVRKALDLEDVIIAARALDEVDVFCNAFFVIGFPGESRDDVRQTLRFAKRLAADFGTLNLLFVANPLPGTPLHRECEEKGYLVNALDKVGLLKGIRINQGALIATNEFTKRDLFALARQELDVPEILSTGQTMPYFTANSPVGRRRFARIFGRSAHQVPRFPWSRGCAA